MKTQKIFLLVLVLLLALCLASCDDTEASKAPDCFVFDEQASFDDVVELEGEIIESCSSYDIVALENIELKDDGTTERTVEVLDLSDGNRVLFKRTDTISAGSMTKDTEYDISQYPIISVKRYAYNGSDAGGNLVFNDYTSFYLIKKDGEAESVISDVAGDEEGVKVVQANNVYLAAFGGKMHWISRDLQIMRSVVLDTSNSYIGIDSFNVYDYFGFDAEYNGYLYTEEFNPQTMVATIIVYAPNGVASAQYNYSSGVSYAQEGESIINPKMYVMNNGNVLIQECVIVEDDGEYDFVYGALSQKIKLSTKVMDHTSGAVTELDYDYLITNFESAYAGEDYSGFAFKLAEGYDNQATLVSIADGKLGRATEYVVLDNSLERKYTLNNKYLANYGGYEMIGLANAEGYVAEAYIDGRWAMHRFDWDGNVVFTYPTNVEEDIWYTHYVTDSGVYANDGSLIFDIEEFGADYVESYGSSVFLRKEGYLKNVNYGGTPDTERAILTYKLDINTGKAELVADSEEGEHAQIATMDGAYMVANMKKHTISVYNKAGTVVLIAAIDDVVDSRQLDTAWYITVEVGGEYKTYVLTFGDRLIIA